jgi:hypothetical protein
VELSAAQIGWFRSSRGGAFDGKDMGVSASADGKTVDVVDADD